MQQLYNNPYLPSPEEEKLVLHQLRIGHSERGEDASKCDRSCPLNIIIESAVLVPVLFQQSECILVGKIFKLDERVLAVTANHCLHELVDKVVICLPSNSFLVESDVVRIFQKGLSVGSNIKHDWKTLPGFDSS